MSFEITGQVFCRMSFNLFLVNVFSHVNRLCLFQEDKHRDEMLFSIKHRITDEVSLIHWAKVLYAGLLYCKIILTSFLDYIIWNQVKKHSPYWGVRSNVPFLWGSSNYIHHLEFFCIEVLSLLSHSVFSQISLDSSIFILYFVIIQYFIISYLSHCSNCFSISH